MIFEPKLCKFKIDEDYETQMQMYGMALWPKENPFIRKEINMTNHIFKKEPITPVMAEHIKRVNISEPKIEFETVNEEGIDKTIATLKEHIYAKVVDMQDKAFIDAIIDYANNRKFTDVYLIDEEFVKSAIYTKIGRDEEFNNMKGANMIAAEVIERLEKDLSDAEERNNVKDAEIDNLRTEVADLKKKLTDQKKQIMTQADTISLKRDEIKDLKNQNAFLTGVYEGSRVLKKAHAALNEEYKHVCAENQDLLNKNGNLAKRIDELMKDAAEDNRLIEGLALKNAFLEFRLAVGGLK